MFLLILTNLCWFPTGLGGTEIYLKYRVVLDTNLLGYMANIWPDTGYPAKSMIFSAIKIWHKNNYISVFFKAYTHFYPYFATSHEGLANVLNTC